MCVCGTLIRDYSHRHRGKQTEKQREREKVAVEAVELWEGSARPSTFPVTRVCNFKYLNRNANVENKMEMKTRMLKMFAM